MYLIALKFHSLGQDKMFDLSLEVYEQQGDRLSPILLGHVGSSVRGKLPLPCANYGELATSYRAWAEAYRWILQTPKRGFEFDEPSENRSEISFKPLQLLMQDWYDIDFPSWNRIKEQVAIAVGKNAHQDTRILIWLHPDLVATYPELAKLPWDEMFTKQGLYTSLCIRDFEQMGAIASLKSAQKSRLKFHALSSLLMPKVRVLHLIGSDQDPEGRQDIDLAQDIATLDRLKKKTNLVVERVELHSFRDIGQALRHRQGFDLLVYSGHSLELDFRGYIVLRDGKQTVTIEDFKESFKQLISNGLKLAFFNSCLSATLASALLDLGLNTAIATREIIYEPVAQKLLESFFTEYAEYHHSVYDSLKRAIASLEDLSQEFPGSKWLPVIYQHPQQVPPHWREFTATTKETRSVVGVSAGVTAAVLTLRMFGVLEGLELKTYDQFLRWRSPSTLAQDERVVVVTIDRKDLELLKADYPDIDTEIITDRALTALIQKIQTGQPSLIGIDIWRNSPTPLNQPDDHAQLSQFINNSENILTVCQVAKTGGESVAPPTGVNHQHLVFSDLLKDADDTVRRQLFWTTGIEETKCPAELSLSFQLAISYLESLGYQPRLENETFWIRDHDFPYLKDTHYWRSPSTTQTKSGVNYAVLFSPWQRHTAGIKEVPVRQFFNDPNFDPTMFKDRIVLIGYDREDDYHRTSYEDNLPGVILHAQMVRYLLDVVLDGRPRLRMLSHWNNTFWIIGWGVITGGTVLMLLRLQSSGVVIGVTVTTEGIVLCGVCFGLLAQVGLWVPVTPALFMISIITVVYRGIMGILKGK